jgi:hypothetical protein
MICTRCGAIQQREAAKFCHVCGMVFEPATASHPADDTTTATSEAAPQEAQQSIGTPPAGNFLKPALLEQQHPQEAAILVSSNPSFAPEQPAESASANPFPAWEPPSRVTPVSRPRPERERPVRGLPSTEERMQPPYEAQEYAVPLQAHAPAMAMSPHSSPLSTNRHAQQRAASAPGVEQDQPPLPERPYRRPPQSTRGPVPGGLASRQRPRSHRMLLGLFVPLALIVVFVLVGLGVYSLVTTPSLPEPSAFLTYTDPHQQFSIQYPNVWTQKQLENGVRFTDVTNTAELSVTYTPNTANQTAEQFANQQAAKEGISTPDTKTFAGQTWVVRSGIVTQTSGVSQDIFLFVTLHNNIFFEIREVAPLDGYREPNQTAFMPMLQSLVLR